MAEAIPILNSEAFELQNLNVLCLPAFGALRHRKLHGLTFLQAAESFGLDRAEMNENIFAILPRDEAKTFCVVKPLNGALFHCVLLFSVY